MTFWSYGNIKDVTGGRWLVSPDDEAVAASGVSIDTRTLEAGQIYLAIIGERLDGHKYLQQATEAGARLLVVSDQVQAHTFERECKAKMGEVTKTPGVPVSGLPGPGGPGVLLVDDTLVALQMMARVYRQVLNDSGVKVIAVTGSNGKTTTRHLIHAVLSSRYVVSQSPKSFNNHIGLPLTLLAAQTDHDFVVAEIGTNHPGEIDALSKIAQPDAAVITHLGTAHIGQFGSRQAIADEKACILNHIKSPTTITATSLAVIPGDEPLLDKSLDSLDSRIRIVRITPNPTSISTDAVGINFAINQTPVRLPMLGKHNAQNALAAAAVGHWVNIDDQAIATSLQNVDSIDMRLDVTTIGRGRQSVTILNDAYNANPDSVKAAINTLADYPLTQGRRVLVLADMLELGDQARDMHNDIAKFIVNRSEQFSLVILIGELSANTASTLSQHFSSESLHAFTKWDETLPAGIARLLQPGDVVLLKGSRGMALERLLPCIRDKFGDK